MKIGEFAKKHEVTVDTVRHYISEGLLTPLRKNTQYNFTDIDDRVMDSILLLKSMNFKLDEMKAYLLFQTMYTDNTFSYMGSFRKEFEKKLKENTEEIDRLQKMNKLIEKQLTKDDQVRFTRGVSLKMLDELVCSECREQLELNATEILHNEIMEGTLTCPKCKKTYYVRFGFVSDKPIEDMQEIDDGVAEMAEQYLVVNDKEYIQKIRELFQKMAQIAKKNSCGAKRILIDGESCGFLNSCLLREMPKDARLFVHTGENMNMKLFMEDIFPKETLVYYGDISNAPFMTSMDYAFLQDYDIESYYKKGYKFYSHLSSKARVDCFKTIIYGMNSPFPDEGQFLIDMDGTGLVPSEVYRTGRIINKRESLDMSIIEKDADMELEYRIYTFVKQ